MQWGASFLRLRAPAWIYLLFLIGASTLTARGLLSSGFANSSLLYLGLPFVISLMIHHFIGYSQKKSALGRYLNHLRNATVIMLASSTLLFEGFICVLMFMPIYYFTITLGFIFTYFHERWDLRQKASLGVYALPLIVGFLSVEGVVPTTSLPREKSVTYVAVASAGIIENTSYLYNYLKLKDTHIRFNELDDGKTEVALTVHYSRMLYPAWYFGPLQEFAMNENAKYLVEEIIVRQRFDG